MSFAGLVINAAAYKVPLDAKASGMYPGAVCIENSPEVRLLPEADEEKARVVFTPSTAPPK